jgi:uncharacterized protein DUF1707/uncharacterized protein DUF4190
MTLDPTVDTAVAGPPGVLAANTDRERATDVLKAGFAEGRLTKGEYDDRMARVCAARTYGELGPLVSDLPNGPLGHAARYPAVAYGWRPPLNSTAVASLVCGLGIFITMGLSAVPAVLLGHSARRQVRATGERGGGMALTGMALGWVGVTLIAVAVAGLITVLATAHGVHHPIFRSYPNPGGPLKPIQVPQFKPSFVAN